MKNRLVLGRRSDHSRHEPIYHGHICGVHVGRTAAGRLNWYGEDDAAIMCLQNIGTVMVEQPPHHDLARLEQPHTVAGAGNSQSGQTSSKIRPSSRHG